MAHLRGHDLDCLTIKDLQTLADSRMDKLTRDYYNEGADDGTTLEENHTAYAKYRIRPRVLRDVSFVDTTVRCLGQLNSVPFGVAPTAMQCLAHPDGEMATARACRKANVIMGLSSFSTTSLEDVRAESGPNANVLQLYVFEERAKSVELIERAKRAGYTAVMLTVDTPYLGRRNLEIRNQFALPPPLRAANFQPLSRNEEFVDQDISSIGTHQTLGYHAEDLQKNECVDPTSRVTFHTHGPNPRLTWEESIPWLKRVASPMQVWVKGLATAEDAQLALDFDVDGIVVSNHGGRQLNSTMSSLDSLIEIAAVVNKRIPIHVDGGIRHGSDIFKALALGADFVWIGRPALWGLAYKGEAGVNLCLKLLSDEFKLCMALSGVVRVTDINKQYIARVGPCGCVSKL